MKVRNLRKRSQRMMDTVSWWAAMHDTKMYYIRKVKPCKSYHPYCDDCNAVLFRKEMGRFPHTVAEFNAYGDNKASQHKEN
jgi:hypothetical protein